MTRGPLRTREPVRTRARILATAGMLFARHGFHGVGFREIATRAGVSLQMPHHHFRSKVALFAECVRYALDRRMNLPRLFDSEPSFANPKAAKEAVAEKIRACFFAVIPPSGQSSWCGELLARALVENIQGSLSAFQEGLKPARDWFDAALRCIRPDMTSAEYWFWYVSLWAQISFYATARRAILARTGKRRYDEALVHEAGDRLVRVMLSQLDLK